MRTMTVEMPAVKSCGVSECAYNNSNGCHARAITVGDGRWPLCDTFLSATRHVKQGQPAGVGACKVTSCRFNHDYECQAETIIVGHIRDTAECRTYERT